MVKEAIANRPLRRDSAKINHLPQQSRRPIILFDENIP